MAYTKLGFINNSSPALNATNLNYMDNQIYLSSLHDDNTSNPHATTFAQLLNKPTTVAGYGITDANYTIAVTGIIYDGGTIPLPEGYTQAQCVWMVSPSNYDSNTINLGTSLTYSYHSTYGYVYNPVTATTNLSIQFQCYATSSRLVTAKIGINGNLKSTFANYIIIGVK